MKKLALTVLIIIILLVGIGAGVYLVRRQTEFREKAAPSSSLSLIPSNGSPDVDDTFTVSANINTGANQVVATELHVTFDETKVEAVGATNGTFFTNPKTIGPSIDNNNGTLSYTIYMDPGATPRQGEGTVAVLTFKAKAAGNTTVALSSDTLVGAGSGGDPNDLGANVLTGTTPAVLTIASDNEPTATVTPTVSGPTPTTVTSATSTPTRTPTPTTVSSGTTSSPTNTLTPTPLRTTANPTIAPELPDSGFSLPTVLGIGVGGFVILGALLLAL